MVQQGKTEQKTDHDGTMKKGLRLGELEVSPNMCVCVCVCVCVCMCACAQSCSTLCDPMDGSPSGASVHGTFQAGILGWVAISCSRVSSWSQNRASFKQDSSNRSLFQGPATPGPGRFGQSQLWRPKDAQERWEGPWDALQD